MAGLGGDYRAPRDLAAQADTAPDLTAASVDVIPPEIMAQTMSQYFQAWMTRVRAGDAGVLPVIAALIGVAIVFQIVGPNGVFLGTRNMVDIFDQSAVFIMLAVAEIFVLLLGEIDLSIGYVAAVGGIVAGLLIQPMSGNSDYFHNWPWLGAIAVALVICALIGLIQGLIITRLKMPSFVVTLAGQMFLFGVMIIILGPAGGLSATTSSSTADLRAIGSIVYGYIDTPLAWIALVIIVAVIGGAMWRRDSSRRRSGLVAPPVGLTLLKIAGLAIAGAAVVLICGVDRKIGATATPIVGVPWVLPLLLAVVGGATLVLEQTQFGRHMYAVGGNAEAARRAGIGVAWIRTAAFVIAATLAGLAGVVAVSYGGGITTNFQGGQEVLYAVAAAVIGGTSLLGGRGRAIHGLLGGLTIGAINNGLYLLGLDVQWQYIATALVLLAAVAIDALARRNATAGGIARM